MKDGCWYLICVGTGPSIKVANFDFPNITQSALPMKGIIARYYYYGGDFEKAFDLLHSSRKSNPYIMFNQSLIGLLGEMRWAGVRLGEDRLA